MKIKIQNINYREIDVDLLVVPVANGESYWLNEIDAALDGELKDELVRTGFDAELGAKMWSNTLGKIAPRKICFVGLGDPGKINAEILRRWAGSLVGIANSVVAHRVAVLAPQFGDSKALIGSLVEGLWLAEYRFLDYKTEEATKQKQRAINEAILLYEGDVTSVEAVMAEAAVKVLGTTFARDLVNQPANKIHPSELVEAARHISKQSKAMGVTILDRPALVEQGLGAFLAVAQGSDEEPYLIHLVYKPLQTHKKIALVGKGITFDAGGLSLKPAEAMEEMKIDMAGGAIVLGIFRALVLMDLPLEIHGIIPACENMPSGKATRPGDVVRSYSGKTIEISNTDAEGRLVLADALSYAAKNIQPDILVDLATLTGAAMVALGENVAALMTHDDDLAQTLASASAISGENLWRLPLVEDYRKKMKSDVADLKNIHDDKWAGAIMGGLFLQEFVDEEISFAHIDVAGPAWSKKGGTVSYNPKGATGYGVRTLLTWLKTL
jgi:leucyl aminopeptidase